ncbi:MAG: VOC family protein [Isosphaeraceae bacterium]
MPRQVLTQLMFTGDAAQAIALYTSLFADSEVVQIDRYGPGEHGAEGTVKRAVFTIGGREFACIDSPPVHAFGFTPSISIFVECETEDEQAKAYERLSEGGKALMPLGEYGFSRRFGWVEDRFGVSWQLNLA